jgi:hypothetical protein
VLRSLADAHTNVIVAREATGLSVRTESVGLADSPSGISV